MKALNKRTGEIATNFEISKEFGTICDNEWVIIDEESTFDWNSFRNKATKDILCAIISGGTASGMIGIVPEKEKLVKTSIEIADELIKQLKHN